MCLNEKVLYQYFIAFLSCLGQILLWKQFKYNYIELSEKRKREVD